jgi:hypothetical protein
MKTSVGLLGPGVAHHHHHHHHHFALWFAAVHCTVTFKKFWHTTALVLSYISRK